MKAKLATSPDEARGEIEERLKAGRELRKKVFSPLSTEVRVVGAVDFPGWHDRNQRSLREISSEYLAWYLGKATGSRRAPPRGELDSPRATMESLADQIDIYTERLEALLSEVNADYPSPKAEQPEETSVRPESETPRIFLGHGRDPCGTKSSTN